MNILVYPLKKPRRDVDLTCRDFTHTSSDLLSNSIIPTRPLPKDLQPTLHFIFRQSDLRTAYMLTVIVRFYGDQLTGEGIGCLDARMRLSGSYLHTAVGAHHDPIPRPAPELPQTSPNDIIYDNPLAYEVRSYQAESLCPLEARG